VLTWAVNEPTRDIPESSKPTRPPNGRVGFVSSRSNPSQRQDGFVSPPTISRVADPIGFVLPDQLSTQDQAKRNNGSFKVAGICGTPQLRSSTPPVRSTGVAGYRKRLPPGQLSTRVGFVPPVVGGARWGEFLPGTNRRKRVARWPKPANPYQAPEASIQPPVEKVRGSIWASLRWLPAAWCVMMASGGFAMAILIPGLSLWVLLNRGWDPFKLAFHHPHWVLAKIVLLVPIAGTGAAISLFSARSWMRRRWKWAILATILSYAILVAAAFLLRNTETLGSPLRL